MNTVEKGFKPQYDGKNEDNAKTNFKKLSKLFGFSSKINIERAKDDIELSQKIGNRSIRYRSSKEDDYNVFSIGSKIDDINDYDIYFAIDYSPYSCILILHIPTYKRCNKYWDNGKLVNCAPYTIYYSDIAIGARHGYYESNIYEDGMITLCNGNYLELRPAVGKFSLPPDIAKNHEKYGYRLYGNPGEPESFYKKELAFTPEESQEFIRNILRSSKYFPCLIATLFQKLGCTETCDASEIFRLIVSLLPQQFVTDFFGSEEIYHDFLTRLKRENIRRALDQLQNRRYSGNSASNNPESNYSTVSAENLELLNGIPNLTYEIIDDERHGHGIELSINNTESRQDAKSQYSILFSDNVIDISCEYKKILVDLNSNNPQIEIDGTQIINQLKMYCYNSGPEKLYGIDTTEKLLIANNDIASPIEYIKQRILCKYDFISALNETVRAFISFGNISLTEEQLLGILYASAPRMAAIIKDSDIQPLGGAMKISPIGHK